MSKTRTIVRIVRKNAPFLAFSVIMFATLSLMQSPFKNSLEARNKPAEFEIVAQNSSSVSMKCNQHRTVTSTKLESRHPWSGDPKCARFKISHMIPHCRPAVALASYPGSGNTWVRYLLEGATGIFTGSRYKDLQIQMYGLWGEIRNWADGTTIVQKTHDANEAHVTKDFEGRAILLLRNPYAAILSDHNFLFAGHHGRAPPSNYARKDWNQFVAIQMSRWLEMAANWTLNSNPSKVLVLHYENVKSNPEREMRKVLNFLQIPADPSRLSCMQMHKNGFFVRGSGGSDESEVVPFHQKTRQVIDSLIDRVNAMLFRLGYEAMPLNKYDYYHKTDEEIVTGIQRRNEIRTKSSHTELPFVKDDVIDKSHGTKMVLKEYFKWLDTDQEGGQTQGDKSEDVKTALMKQLFRSLRSNSDQNTITGLSDKAEGLLTKAVEIWPILQKPFQRDPIQDAIETDAYRGETMEDVAGNFKYI
ncbi:WSCD family member AAEL009094-like [Tigriopus californicus]|uniref:WSCD family member AAEL009094-like n=1 Tax=Tigriopus californicus TaxID=6832 RepID=UPI0027DA9AC4|nr:WSCD family member AAEL009094-like [Tigriopus californicus]